MSNLAVEKLVKDYKAGKIASLETLVGRAYNIGFKVHAELSQAKLLDEHYRDRKIFKLEREIERLKAALNE